MELSTLIDAADCPNCGHRVLEHHAGDKCRWREASSSAAAERLRESTPLSIQVLLGPECACTLSSAEALSQLLLQLSAEWALEKFTRLCNDPDWAGQEPSMGFQATYNQFLVEDL